jgi:hypothetical protein
MDELVRTIVQGLDQRDSEFRQQVMKFRSFGEQMRSAGADMKPQGYTVPLMDRIEVPPDAAIRLTSVGNKG